MACPSPRKFNRNIWQFYQDRKRDFPWRQTTDPYQVMVSELMLQQTQTSRVIGYFERFLAQFPTVKKLADAKQGQVLKAWQGLGYNRRALFLQQAAQKIVSDFNSQVPTTATELVTLPGVGLNTAGAILAYAFNRPAIFIETNIRKTIIHFFFADQLTVGDKEIAAVIEKTLDKKNPREWYWAVVDYGSMLGQTKAVANNRSRHYRQQSEFSGSKRFTRSQILQLLLRQPMSEEAVRRRFANLPHTDQAIEELIAEGFCVRQQKLLRVRD